MADRKPLDVHAAAPRVIEALDSVGREYQVEIERPVLELDKILPALDLGRLLVGEPEADFTKRGGQCAAILPRALDKEIRVLGRVGEAEENRAGFSDEQIAHAVALEGIPDLLRLAVFKRSHSPARREGPRCTSAGTPPSSRRIGTEHRPAPACTCE